MVVTLASLGARIKVPVSEGAGHAGDVRLRSRAEVASGELKGVHPAWKDRLVRNM